MDLSKYITEQSGRIWKHLSSIYDISVEYHSANEYTVFIQRDKVVIYVPKLTKPCPDSFAHELLHVLIRSTQTYIGSSITLAVKESQCLSPILSPGLLDHISNCLEHVKMLPIYIEMGFDKSLFIIDYNTPKLTYDEVRYLKSNLKKKKWMQKPTYDPKVVDLYIGKFFAVKACPNMEINYESLLQEFKVIDIELWEILESLWESWLLYDIFKDREAVDPDYHELVFDFIDNLEDWCSNRRIRYR